MKARFLVLAALMLGLASCQTEPEGLDVNVGGEEQTVTINVAIPEAETRAGDKNSALGVFDNGVLGDENDNSTMRYILQVYYKDGVKFVKSKERLVKYSDGKSVAFDVRLVPERDYQFVVWADVVADGKNDTDNHYDTSDLTNITLKGEWNAMDESRDAFTATEFIEDFNSAQSINITLKRPFAKLRVVTTDMKALNNLGIEPKTATVTYNTTDTKHYNAFNAFAGKAIGDSKNRNIKHENFVIAPYGETGDSKTLFTDYFFVSNEGDVVKFEFNVYDQNDELIKSNTFNTDIYVKRNHLTTIMGNILTDGKNVKVDINDAFDQPNIDENIWDGKSVTEPATDADGNYIIYEGSELAWIADQVNGVTRAAANTFKGQTIKLMKDVNLGGNEWTPIGATGKFEGTFDGQNKKIANLLVTEDGKTPVGLFANAYMVKNVKVIGAEIYGHYKAGVIVGNGLCSRIDNCHVEDAIVKVTPLAKDDANHAGGIVGYLSAEGTAYVTNCSVKNAEIIAFRDVAAIAGTANNSANGTVVVSDNTVENVTVTADQTAEYVSNEKDGNAAAVAGRLGSNANITNNTVANDVVIIRKVDSTKEFEYALAERRNDDVIYVGEGEVVLPASLAVSGINKLTIEGLDAKAAVQFNSVAGGADGGLNCYADGTELIFKNIKVVSPNTGAAYSGGFGRAKSVLFDNCYYEGQYRSMSNVKFNKCTIDPKTSYIYTDYSNADFIECTFNCSEGKGVQVYNDGNYTDTTINVTDCTFIAAKQGQTWDDKPVTAIDINSNGERFTVNINNSTATGFPEGLYSGESLFNIKGGAEHVTIKIDGNTWVGKDVIKDENDNYVVNSLTTLETALESAGAAGAGNTTIVFAENAQLDMTNVEWTPIKVDGYNGADIVTIEGNGAVITGLKAPLFAGGFAGDSGIIIKNLTITDSNIVSTNTLGSGAFIESVDSMAKIELTNCHLIDSSVTGGAGSRTGGLIGWTAGYSNQNDGPVKTYVTIDGCSVIGCTITCDGSVGGINGHAGNNDWTYTTIKNCTIKNNTLASTDDGAWRVGVVVGTANVGELTISNITESGNTLTQTGKTAPEGYLRNYYGRAVLGATGKLTIDGYKYVAEGLFEDADGNAVVGNQTALKAAIEAGNDTIFIKGEIDLATVVLSGYNGTIIGADDTAAINTRNFTPSADEAYQLRSTNLTFKSIDVKLPTGGDWIKSGFVGTGSIKFEECNFEGQVTLNGSATWTFNDCTFVSTESGNYASFVYGATKATFNRCSFSGVDRAAKVYGTGGTLNVEYNTCEFTSSSLNKSGVEIDASYATTTVALNECTQTAMAGLFALKGSKGTVLVDGVAK